MLAPSCELAERCVLVAWGRAGSGELHDQLIDQLPAARGEPAVGSLDEVVHLRLPRPADPGRGDATAHTFRARASVSEAVGPRRNGPYRIRVRSRDLELALVGGAVPLTHRFGGVGRAVVERRQVNV